MQLSLWGGEGQVLSCHQLLSHAGSSHVSPTMLATYRNTEIQKYRNTEIDIQKCNNAYKVTCRVESCVTKIHSTHYTQAQIQKYIQIQIYKNTKSHTGASHASVRVCTHNAQAQVQKYKTDEYL